MNAIEGSNAKIGVSYRSIVDKVLDQLSEEKIISSAAWLAGHDKLDLDGFAGFYCLVGIKMVESS